MSCFETVLVANRGEIAVRITRTLHALGIRAAAVYSDADADARHVREADVARRIGPAAPLESYLHVERVLDAAVALGADALHPGYGFLAENAALAEGCAERGICFVGPSPAVIRATGDKIGAKRIMAAAGVPVVPGSEGSGLSDEELLAVASQVGFPIIVKPAAGGGGKGMEVVRDPDALPAALAAGRRQARGAFGDDTLLVERYLERPRHIEVQVLADEHGHVVHLGERECSLQRRHQKIVEEAPSVLLSPASREAIGDLAVTASRACGYTNAGTVELVVSADRPDELFFIEMNARLQVEHRVTELVRGIDLVELQLRVAAGEPLPWAEPPPARGHAIEARVYAEDPAAGFLPTGGAVRVLREPSGPGVVADSGLLEGTVVGSDYDPMLAKIVAVGRDRQEALGRLDGALGRTAVLGVVSNIGFLRTLLRLPEVRSGDVDTASVERHTELQTEQPIPDDAVAAVCLFAHERSSRGDDPWSTGTGWRHGTHAPLRFVANVSGRGEVEVGLRIDGDTWHAVVSSGDEHALAVSRHLDGRDRGELSVTWDGSTVSYVVDIGGAPAWIGTGGRAWSLTVQPTIDPERTQAAGTGDGLVRSPMPGTVIAVAVAAGDAVETGQPVAVVEAMKTEHTLRAPIDGVAANLNVEVGDQVAKDEVVVTIEPAVDEPESAENPAVRV